MADVDFHNLLDLNLLPWSYQDEEIYGVIDGEDSNGASLVSNADCSDDIEYIYTSLHQSVDQVVAKISVRTPPRLDQIREQNRGLIEKLTSLENAITADTTAVHHVLLGSELPDTEPSTSSVAGASRRCSGSKRRRTSRPVCTINRGIADSSFPETAKVSAIQDQDYVSVYYSQVEVLILQQQAQPRSKSVHSQSSGLGSPSSDTTPCDSKLGEKLLQIGTQEARTRVAKFVAQIQAPHCRDEDVLPNMYQFSSMSQITDVSHFLRLLLNLGLAIESSIFGEKNSRIKKRVAFAHFYHAYTLAQDNPKMFLSWCDDQQVQGGYMLPKGGVKSVVQQRFADLIFSGVDGNGGISPAGGLSGDGDDLSKRIAKIQMWRKSGKKWAQIIQRFGYGILLLLPSSLSDEELRVAKDKVVARSLDLLETRKHLFADVLKQANDLLSAHFFPQDENSHLTNMPTSPGTERAHWGILLNSHGADNLERRQL